MKTFLIGVIGVSVVALISLFVPSFYSYSWGYANFQGVVGDAAVSHSAKVYFSLANSLGGLAYLIFGITFVGLLLYTILMLTKNSNLVPLPLIFVLAILPVVVMIIGVIQSKVDGNYIKVGNNLVIGAGKNAGLGGWGVLCLVLLVAFYLVIVKGFTLVRKKIETENAKGTKTLKVKTQVSKCFTDDDFKL